MPKRKPKAKKLPERLTRDEADRLLSAPSLKAPTGLRNHVLMRLMLRCGLRCEEVIELRTGDIRDGDLHLKRTKGAKHRVVPMAPDTERMLEQWLEKRPGNGNGRVFVTLKGGPLSSAYVRQMVHREAESAGIDRLRVHPHLLRHTAASQWLEDGFTVQEVGDLLGHSNLSTTAIYLHANPVAIREKIRNGDGESRPGDEAQQLAQKIAEMTDEQREALKALLG